MHNTRIFMFTGNLEGQSCSDCVQWIGQCYLSIQNAFIQFQKHANQLTKSFQLVLTAVTPAPAPAMNLSPFFMILWTGISEPTY